MDMPGTQNSNIAAASAEASTQVSMWTGTSLRVLVACLGCWLPGHQVQAAGAQAALRSEASGQRELSNNFSFSTKFAHFESDCFADLPGWQLDDLGDAWAAFLQTCSVLGKREAWEGTCKRARPIKAGDSALVRGSFENEFKLFQIQNGFARRQPAHDARDFDADAGSAADWRPTGTG
ncbi:MAG: Membrane-bound lytic murein transglycosylase precursor [Massilia sp.]|nr:Membrane-bound lytic murein transglycosylase precursor [Massilia sp.]